jgi:hypothetical protein
MPETFQPNDCLASRPTIGDCAVSVPTEPSPSDGFAEAFAAESPSVSTLNLTKAFCPTAPVCLPVVGGRPVWRDDHHFTAEYALARREAVWKALVGAGVLGGKAG